MSSFLSSLYILEISHLSDVELVKIFSHSVGCCFVLLIVSFALQKLLSFRRSHLLIVALSVCSTGIIFKKQSPVPMHSWIFPTFSSMSFNVAGFRLRSLIYLYMSFVCGDRYEFIWILLHSDIELYQHQFKSCFLFFHFRSLVSFSKIRSSQLCKLISRCLFPFHWPTCLFVCQYQVKFITIALQQNLK